MAGRYKASLIDSEAYLLACMRYIETNPVRTGRVDSPGEDRWSSYAGNARGESSRLINNQPVYDLAATALVRPYACRELFRFHASGRSIRRC
jgi:putative transposase